MKKLLIIAMTLLFANSLYAATLVWDASKQATRYQVYIKKPGETNWEPLGDETTTTSFKLPDMASYDQDYELSVKALNRWGNTSDFSETLNYNQLQSEIVEPVKNLKIIVDINLNISVK